MIRTLSRLTRQARRPPGLYISFVVLVNFGLAVKSFHHEDLGKEIDGAMGGMASSCC